MRLRVPTVIPVTRFAFGSSVPETKPVAAELVTGFTRLEGNPGGSRFSVMPQRWPIAALLVLGGSAERENPRSKNNRFGAVDQLGDA